MPSLLDLFPAAFASNPIYTRRSLTTVALILALSTTPLPADAQGDTPHAYVAQITGLVTELDEKVVYEALNGWEVVGHFEVSGSAHRFKFTATAVVSEAELTDRLTGTGTAVLWLADVQPDGSLSSASYEAHAFPVFEDTGEPAADNARYDADKSAWLAAHPGWVDKNTRPDTHHGTETEVVR